MVAGVALVVLLFMSSGSNRSPMVQGEGSLGWRIPDDAATRANPVAPTEAVLAQGRRLYESRCQRCHGPAGRGNGPDADPHHPPGNLTDPARTGRNPDGVIFYKVWNGRQSPKMPAFKTELTPDEVWAIVHHVKTLRR
jgi:mono/diheme cytochrome c family protein